MDRQIRNAELPQGFISAAMPSGTMRAITEGPQTVMKEEEPTLIECLQKTHERLQATTELIDHIISATKGPRPADPNKNEPPNSLTHIAAMNMRLTHEMFMKAQILARAIGC